MRSDRVLLASLADVVVQCGRDGQARRRVTEVWWEGG